MVGAAPEARAQGQGGRAVRGRTASLLALAAALAAAVAGFAGPSGRPPSTLVAQGGLAPLVAAERAVASGDATSALASFQVALGRARRENARDVFERVRWRVASAGRELMAKDPAAGWSLVAPACLLAPDFSVASEAAEGWCLGTGRSGPSFEYPLIGDDGQSVWRTGADRMPLWLLRRLPHTDDLKVRGPALAGISTDRLPAEGRLLLVTPLRLRLAPGYRFALAARPQGAQPRAVFVSVHGSVLWDQPLAASDGGWRRAEFTPPRDWVLDRLLVVADDPGLRCEAMLVREYEALPGDDAP